MEQTGRLTSFYKSISNEEDAKRVLSDLSIFWYAYGIILIASLLMVTIFTKEKVSFYFPIILLFSGFFLSRRKSRVLSSFILFYSSALIGFVIWYFSGSTSVNYTLGLILLLVIVVLIMCSLSAYRSVKAAFIYHNKIGSQIFMRNIFLACGFVLVLPLVVPLPYVFSEIPWQHIQYTDIYKYFVEEMSVYIITAVIAVILFAILTHYFPLVYWSRANVNQIQQRMASLYKPILNEKDAESVLSDLSMLWYVFGIALIILSLIVAIMTKKQEVSLLFPIIFLLAGYLLPRTKSRTISLAILLYTVLVMAVAIWVFLITNPPKFSLWLAAICAGLNSFLIILITVLGTWAAYRSTIATFVYHRHS